MQIPGYYDAAGHLAEFTRFAVLNGDLEGYVLLRPEAWNEPPDHVKQPDGVDRERQVSVHCPSEAIEPSGTNRQAQIPNRLTGDTTVPKRLYVYFRQYSSTQSSSPCP